jgi:hypothetical protein
LSDSLELAKDVYRDLLPLLKDSVSAWEIVSLVENLLDSNLVPVDHLIPYKQQLYSLADKALKQLKAGAAGWYNYHTLIRVLPLLKDPVANQWTRKFLLQSNRYIKRTAALAMLRNKQPVEATEWLKLAADKELRPTVYSDLEELGKTNLFPKQYYTEQAFGESQLYALAADENEVKKMTFIGERIATWNGQRKKFYLYRIDLEAEDGIASHLGIAGPYGLKPGKPTVEADAVGIYWGEPYSATKIDSYLKAWLKDREANE